MQLVHWLRNPWYAIWSILALIAVAQWWLLPGGFPLWHLRSWSNRVLPCVELFVALMGLYATWRGPKAVLLSMSVFPPALILSAAFTTAALFPMSAWRLLPVLLIVGALVTFDCYRSWKNGVGPMLPALAIGLLGAATGALLVLAQRGPDPDTRPLDSHFPWPEKLDAADRPTERQRRFDDESEIDLHTGTIRCLCGPLTLEVQPLLTFLSRSPDRCWTIFAPRGHGRPQRHLLGSAHGDRQLFFEDSGLARHQLGITKVGHDLRIEANCRLSEAVFSHLNSYCSLTISGHDELQLGFSPCPETRIPVMPFGYPIGRPVRLGFLDADGIFHVVEARSGEKGPFTELASGPLADDDALTITLHDGSRAVGRVTLHDWARQAGRQLSPTAGWGMPVNAIEFARRGDAPRSACQMWISLAATSVGRGWDSVGHAAGVYRNRIAIGPAE